MSALLQDLNPEQRAAVLEPAKRLLVLAGAGAGKTKTLIQKILHLIFVEQWAPGYQDAQPTTACATLFNGRR